MTDQELRAAMKEYLVQNGAVLRGNTARCPWHDDSHASAVFDIRFKCFACEVTASNIIWLIQDREGVPRAEAERIAVGLLGGSHKESGTQPAASASVLERSGNLGRNSSSLSNGDAFRTFGGG